MPKLLIVDDEHDILEFGRRFFRRRGVEVETSPSGEDALEKIPVFQPDLVLLDVTMEKLSGVDVLKWLREQRNDVAVIMVTGVEEEATINECNSWGVKGYIHKPLVLEELEKIVLSELGLK